MQGVRTIDRPIPLTAERAATEAISARRHLEAALSALSLALEIADELDGQVRPEVRSALERALERVAPALAALETTIA